jgi:cephalosporin-C deacetylase-like acetyl esterase
MTNHSVPEKKGRRSLWIRITRGAFLVFAFLILAIAIVKWIADARYFIGYDPSAVPNVTVLERTDWHGHVREMLRFEGDSETGGPALFHYPKDATQAVPCLVLLYGIGQKMTFLDEIADFYVDAGFGIVCREQLGQGERKPETKQNALEGLLQLRRRGRTTVLEARRMLDYLSARREIDADRFYLFGISLGAMLGTSALALEPRYQAGILMWGGGDFTRLFTRNDTAKDRLKSYQKLLMRWGASFLKPADPINRVHLISPRPLLFQNALHDEIVPRECTEAYFNQAGEPKQILWYDCGHEKGLSEELIRNIVEDQIKWLKTLG